VKDRVRKQCVTSKHNNVLYMANILFFVIKFNIVHVFVDFFLLS